MRKMNCIGRNIALALLASVSVLTAEEVPIKDAVLADYQLAAPSGQAAPDSILNRGPLKLDLVRSGEGGVTGSDASPYGKGGSLVFAEGSGSYKTAGMPTTSGHNVIYEAYVCAEKATSNGLEILLTIGADQGRYHLAQQGARWVLVSSGTKSRFRSETKQIGPVEPGKWTHLAIVMEGLTYSLYLNGNHVGVNENTVGWYHYVQWGNPEKGGLALGESFNGKIARARVSTFETGSFVPADKFFLNTEHNALAEANREQDQVVRKSYTDKTTYPYHTPPSNLTAEEFTARKQRLDWFYKAKYGIFVHFLAQDYVLWRKSHVWTPEGWDAHVAKVDVEAFAEQCKQVGAGFVVISFGQNYPYYCTSNPIIDKMAGDPEGKYSSERDLPMDLWKALDKRGIKMMLYVTGHHFQARAKPHLKAGAANDEWCKAMAWYSRRYGKRCFGWWVDGLEIYAPKHPSKYHEALREGNPDTIICSWNQTLSDFDHGHCSTDWEREQLDVPTGGRWTSYQNQAHTILHLGIRWGGPNTPKSTASVVEHAEKHIGGGGVITYEIGSVRTLPDGTVDSPCLEIPEAQMQQLLAVKEAVKDIKRPASGALPLSK